MTKIKAIGMAVMVVALTLAFVPALDAQELKLLPGVIDGLKADKPWGKIEVKGAFDLWEVKAATFLDVRTPPEFEEGHIPGASNVPLDQLLDSQDKLPADRDALIVVYCKSGWRASIGMVAMRMLGYTNAKGFDGSWLAWTAAKHPVKAGSNP